MRHAKSSWDDPGLSDFDRPLNDRGTLAAPLMGEVIGKKGLSPDVIISSPARRASQTAELVRPALGTEAEIVFDRRIYEADVGALREIVQQIDDQYDTAMLVGHNPTIAEFLQYLTGRIETMPTAAVAVVELDIGRWAEMTNDSGRLAAIFRPKEVTK
jgi:phosphohistidine phosphatase